MTTIAFRVPCIPKAQPRQRTRAFVGRDGRPMVQNYTPVRDPVNSFKATVRMAAEGVYQGPPLRGPLRVTMTFIFPRPQSKFRKTLPMPREFMTKKPDGDNLWKSCADALIGLLFADDAQLCDVRVRKLIAAGHEQPSVRICVSEIKLPAPDAEPVPGLPLFGGGE